jgi:uncharacterized protein
VILYSALLTHVRHRALTRRFTHHMRLWLVDLDDLPVSRLLSFRAADHLGAPDRSIRQNLTAWLATRGVPAPEKVLMLTSARTLGYVFNPLTVYWCHDADGAVKCVVAEVHNTYGERHCYLLRPDGRWQAGTDKEFYVSPFLDVSGHYRMRLPPPDERLSLTIALSQDGESAFTATLAGRRVGADNPRQRLGYALSATPQRVRFLIQRHGIALWLKRLPVVARAPHVPQEGVQ